MIRKPILVLLLLLLTSQVVAQEPRSVAGDSVITDVRPLGETRMWGFMNRGITFGRLISQIESVSDDGTVQIREQLTLDYSKLPTSAENKTASGVLSIGLDGSYRGSDFVLGLGEVIDTLRYLRDGNQLEGYFTRNGSRIERSYPSPGDVMTWEPEFVDQLELWAAFQDFKVGDSIHSQVYMPNSLYSANVVGEVTYWMWQEIYEGFIDSVFIVRLNQPQKYQLYFTEDKKLLRVDFVDRDIRVYQEMIRPAVGQMATQQPSQSGTVKTTAPQSKFSWKLVVVRIPHYLAYLFFSLLILALVHFKGLKEKLSYLALALGAGGVLVVIFLQSPFQEYLIQTVLAPAVAEGGSLLKWGIIPAGVSGLFQEFTKLALLLMFLSWQKMPLKKAAGIGAFIGAGFGIAEAVYVGGLSVVPLFDWNLVERVSVIGFHTASGFILGVLWSRDLVRTKPWSVGLVIVGNASLRYLPVLVPAGVAEPKGLHFLLILIALATVVVAIQFGRTQHRVKFADAEKE